MSSANETASEMAIKEEEPCVILEIPSTKVKILFTFYRIVLKHVVVPNGSI